MVLTCPPEPWRRRNTRRSIGLAIAVACTWLGPSLLAQPAASDAATLKTLVTEYSARPAVAASRGLGVLPTFEQAKADSTWADQFLVRLHRVQPDRLSHDDWITYAMLERDADIARDAANYFWFQVPITPYASPLRGVTGSFAVLPLKTDADVAAYVDALNRVPVVMASYEARLRTMATPTSPNIADIEACGMWMATPATDTP